jgi:hypothetical protein
MFQVFERHVANVCSKYFIYFQTSIAIFLSGGCIYFTHILQQYVPNVSVVSTFCYSKWFHVASCNMDVSCVSQTCRKCVFQMFHLLLNVCCIQIFFMLQVFYVVQPGASGVGTRPVTVVLRSGCAKGVLVLLISAPECYPRGERGGGQG